MNSSASFALLPLTWMLLAGSAAAQGSDSCAGATPISGPGVFAFDNTAATTDGPSSSACNFFGTSQIGRDVWFAWTSTFSDTATVETCGLAGIDSKIAAYAGTSCPVGTPLDCDDDSCGLQSRISFPAVAGNVYLLRIGSYPGAAGGAGAFSVSEGLGSGGCADPPAGPDVIVGALEGIDKYGAVGGITGYAIGTTSCNVGDQELDWIAGNELHPVIAQNLYRIEDGRIEQIGMSWLKHGFTALQEELCCDCISSGTGSRLGVGCSDPYSASLNGQQSRLGPRFEVDPFTGVFAYPFTAQGQSGDAIYKRLQVANSDLDPALHPGALYLAEGHYVTQDDAAAGNQDNNASWRRVQVGSFSSGGWNLSFTGITEREQPAIRAWEQLVPGVQVEELRVPGDGLLLVGSHATDNGDGTWHYEYAVHNLNSARAAGRFRVPLPPGAMVTGVGFHDVPYHSGEPYDGSDWSAQVAAGHVEWSTLDHAVDPNANALRWGTLYNFRFDADVAPEDGLVELGLFVPGSPASLQAAARVPGGEGCGWSSFCVAAPNSAGPGALIGATGSTSVSAADLQLSVSGGIPTQFGVFFYAATQTQLPLGDGFLCVGPGSLFRIFPPIAADGSGGASLALDFGQPPVGGGPGRIEPGSTWSFQYWYRDPGGPGGTGFNLSDALEALFCP